MQIDMNMFNKHFQPTQVIFTPENLIEQLTEIFPNNPSNFMKNSYGTSFLDTGLSKQNIDFMIHGIFSGKIKFFKYTVSDIAEPDETDPEIRGILTTLKGISRARSYPTFLLYWWAYNFFKKADCNLNQRSSYVSAYLGISTPFVEDPAYNRYYGTRPERISGMLLRCGEVDLYRLINEIAAGHSKIWLFPFNTEVFNEEDTIVSFSCYLMDIDEEFLKEMKNQKEEEHLRISRQLSNISL